MLYVRTLPPGCLRARLVHLQEWSIRTTRPYIICGAGCSIPHLSFTTLTHVMPNSNGTTMRDSLTIPVHSAASVRDDLSSPIQEPPYITRVVLRLPLEIYHLLVTALGGELSLMNALSPSFVEVQIDDGTTSMCYCGHLRCVSQYMRDQPVKQRYQ